MSKKYLNINFDYKTNPWATHQLLLLWAIENSLGDVLELGVGDSSTTLLHEMLKNTDRELISIDDNQMWMNKYYHLNGKNHRFIHINDTIMDWENKINEFSDSRRWGVVFVDHASKEDIWKVSRPYAMEKFLEYSDFVVAHDSDLFPHIKNGDYNCFEYIPTYKPIPHRNGPPSYLLSKIHNLNHLTTTDIENLVG